MRTTRTRIIMGCIVLLSCGACSWLGFNEAPTEHANNTSPTLTEEDLPNTGILWDQFPPSPPTTPPKEAHRLWVAPGGTGDGSSEDQALGSISQATQVAKSGDWIMIKSGQYTEGPPGHYVGIPITTSNLTLTSYGEGRAVIKPASPEHKYGVLIEADDITLRGLEFDGFRANGVAISSGATTQKNIVLQNLILRMGPGPFRNGILIADNPALQSTAVLNGLRIEDVQVLGADLGITCGQGPCKNMWFERVKVSNKTGAQGSGADAIAVERGDNIFMRDVEATGASADGIDLKATRVLLSRIHVHHNKRNGVKLWSGGTLFNALIEHHGADVAVALQAPGTYRIVHTMIAYHNYKGSSSYVMTVGYGQTEPIELQIENSVFWRNAGGIHLSEATHATIHHTFFADSDNGKFIEQGTFQILADTEEDALKRWGEGNRIVSSLEFKDDFHLPKDSPLRDAGGTLKDAPGQDLNGNKRHQGKAPDVGPFEESP